MTNCKCGDKWRNCAGTFQDCINLTDIVGLETLDFMTYAPKNIGSFFSNCQNLKESTIRKCETWNVGTPETISDMFTRCTQLTSIDLSGWDLSNATNLGNLCRECSNLKYVTLNLTGALKNIDYAFHLTSNLKSLKGLNDRVGNMFYTFREALSNVEYLDIDFTNTTVINYLYACGTNNILTDINLTGTISSVMDSTSSNHPKFFDKFTALSVDCLVKILNALVDYSSDSTTYTLTLGSVNLAKLNSEQIKIATDKGWTLN